MWLYRKYVVGWENLLKALVMNEPRLQAVKQILLFIATHKINKHTYQLISVNALGLAHKTIQFYAIKFVQKYYQP